jgi:release factor glutamine methyltransferase
MPPKERLSARMLYRSGVLRLKKVTPFPEKEYLAILASILNVSNPSSLVGEMDRLKLDGEVESRLECLLVRRESFEPLAYILGFEHFWGRRFVVNPHVLIPRPETELLLQQFLSEVQPDAQGVALDLGTGSGIIAISIAMERRKIQIIGSDLSQEALKTARVNSFFHGVSPSWVQGDLLRFIPENSLDYLISNPPYVPEKSRNTLPPTVLRFEPQTALFSGDDGLRHILRILKDIPRVLKPGGQAFLEIGKDQSDTLEQVLCKTPIQKFIFLPDFAQIPRILVIKK